MNERKVYLGKFNNSKKEELIEKSLKHLKDNRGDEFFYVLPNGELLKKYRRYFIENINSAFDINLLTFDDIVERFAGNLDYIDNAMKNLIIKNVLQELNSKKELDYFKAHIDMDGFVSSCNYIIGEIKRSLIQPEEYLDRCPRESLYLEIGYIYREYENTLTNLNLIDREGKYFLGIEKLKEKKGHLKNLKFIIIDEFYDFRPIEIALLKELSKEDLNIYINFPFDTGNRAHILENTLEILKELGFHIESVEKASFNYFEELGDNLFKDIESKFKKKDELKIIEGQSKYLEVKKIFQYIKRYYLEGEKLENMAIVLSHPDYIDTIHKVSGEDSVPISIPEKLQLNSLPIINEILNILSLNLGTNLRKHIINRVKSIYFPILNMSFNEKYEYILKKEKFENSPRFKGISL